MTRISLNGIELNVEAVGSGDPLVLLHGFTGNADGWLRFAEYWPGIRLIAIDLVGHGRSDAPAEIDHYLMSACVDDIASVLDKLAIDKAAVLGYSMGGRAALHFALRHGDRLSALLLESASCGYDDPVERAARVRSDEDLADRIERNGIDAFVDYWQSIPLWQSQLRLPEAQRLALRRQRLTNTTAGLANSLRGMGAGTQEPVMGRLQEVVVPTLFMAGELDGRYVALAREMAARVQGAEVNIVSDAGHAAHFERAEAFAATVGAFLSRIKTSMPSGGMK